MTGGRSRERYVDGVRERERDLKSPVTTVWITRIVEEVEEEVAVLFASILPHRRRRRVVLCCGNAIVWELVISAEDSYYIIILCVVLLLLIKKIYHTLFAFVDVFGTIDSFVAGSTRTSVRTVDRTCVAYGIGVTRVRRARVIKVAQETCEKSKHFVISHCAKLCVVGYRHNTI